MSRKERIKECRERLEQEARGRAEEQKEKILARAEEEKRTGEKKRGSKPAEPYPVPDAEARANVTDPESRIMKMRCGYVQAYNAQAVVARKQIIVAAEVTQEANDVNQFAPMLDAVRESDRAAKLGRMPDMCLADAGYWSEANGKVDGRRKTELLIMTRKDWRRRKDIKESPPPRGRIPKSATTADLMERKLRTKRGQHLYPIRSQTSEPVFGQIKGGRGIDRFLLRGVRGGSVEWKLICGTHNLLKMWRHGGSRAVH